MKYLYLILFICASFWAEAQIASPEYLSEGSVKTIGMYNTTRKSKYIIYMPMSYSNFVFTEKEKNIFKGLKNVMIERIDLVYSKFVRRQSFDQIGLNRERYEKLQEVFPDIFDNNLIKWNLYAQDGKMEYETAQDLFHGFVIYLKPHGVTDATGYVVGTALDPRADKGRKLSSKEEIAHIDKFIKTSTKTVYETVYDTTYIEKKRKKFTGRYYPNSIAKRKKGIRYKKPGNGRKKVYKTIKVKERKITERKVAKTVVTKEDAPKKVAKITKDSVVLSSLNRNMANWRIPVIVEDVTGSMHPYLAQLLMWMRFNISDEGISRFVFFNDGDASPDGPLGNTGGLYPIKSTDVEEVEQLAYKAMEAGSGGRAPENDIEAMILAAEKYPEATDIILIADNWSYIRDMRIVDRLVRLGKPVRIIVCGVIDGHAVNIDYIRLARKTGGSVHTMTKDFLDLAEKKKGTKMRVAKQLFQLNEDGMKLTRE